MFASISDFGPLNTAANTIPLGVGLLAFARDGMIDPRNRLGKLCLLTMLAGSFTMGFLPAQGFALGPVLPLLMLALLAAGMLTLRGRWRGPGYVQTLSLSASFFLLLFAMTEAMARLPVGDPVAAGSADPSLLSARLVLLAAFIRGLGFQLIGLRDADAQKAEGRDPACDGADGVAEEAVAVQ
jgi:hypothetical protein